MVPACKISAKSVHPFLSYAGHRHTDRHTHKQFKNITSLTEVKSHSKTVKLDSTACMLGFRVRVNLAQRIVRYMLFG